MKRFRITLTKSDAKMTALIGYHVDDWPSEVEYGGDLEKFVHGGDAHPTFLSSLSRFEKTARWQAERCRAEIVIEDLGGEAEPWRDNLVMPDN